uniref:Uncharacterized protein n=1 Tax=Acrobeloides nanus TaxID=290746 RepID=A0A914CDD6_9BILA
MRLKFWRLIWVFTSFLAVSYGFIAGSGVSVNLDQLTRRVELKPQTWIRAGAHPDGRNAPPDQLQIPVTLKTQSTNGRLLTIYGRELNDVVFTLAIKVEDGFIAFNLIDEKGANIASGRGEKVNDNLRHDFVIRIDGKERLVGISGNISTLIHAQEKIIDAGTDVEVKIVVGHEGEEDSILGCISLLSLALGNDIDILAASPENEFETCEIETKEQVLAPIGEGTEVKPENPPDNIFQPPDNEQEPVKEKEDDDNENISEEEQEDSKEADQVPNEKDEPIIEIEPKDPLPENNTISLKTQEEDGPKIGTGVLGGGKKPDPNQELNCRPEDRTMCQNYKSCTRKLNETDFKCACKDGFAGRFCQFSTFPRSCYDAIKFLGEKEDGVYEIDLDGSGPMEPTFVECTTNGTTIVSHNMPTHTQVRSPTDTSSKYFPVLYKLFSEDQLKALIKQSESCEQYVKYECEGAPLRFPENKTFFVTPNHKNVRQIGNLDQACPCNEYGCNQRKACQCDASGVGQKTDEGSLKNENAGVIKIYTRKYDKTGTAYMTLGPLVCNGEAGHAPSQAVTFKHPSAKIQITESFGWTRFEFEFRTNQAEVSSLLAAVASSGYGLNVGLTTGHRVVLNLRNSANHATSELTVSIMSQSKLSDLKWHRITVEILKGDVRLTVDKLNAFEKFDHTFPETRFSFGATENSENGFVGCLRNFIVGDRLVNLIQYLSHDKTHQGCTNLCEKHLCEQGSRCIEHFEDGTTTCECKNKFIHSGERCEQNVNKDTEVSFHNSFKGFLKYKTDDLTSNPLTSNIIFSARTDQKRALFVYAHDQNDNFVQVHLADEYRIVLTLNNKTEVKHCTVYSQGGKEFSDMRWLQIVVERSDERTTLTVDDEMCEIAGKIFLAEDNIEDAVDVSTMGKDDILPPKAAGPVVAQPYQILFVGGVPRAQIGNKNGRRKRERPAYYITDIPSILGCMRGFMLGTSLLDLRYGGTRPSDATDVRVGCENDCDSIVCNNGGHCTVQWHNYDPSIKELTGCDCSKTSYYGSNCLKDAGVMFSGVSAIFFNMSEPRRFVLHESDEQTFQFAFAPTLGNHQLQRLATIYFDDNRQFQVTLNRNDSINVAIVNPNNDSAKVWTFAGNFSDGYRHFFQSTFTQQDPILILVDSEKKYLDDDIRLHLGDARAFYFGGLPVQVNEGPKRVKFPETTINHSVINRYRGCMSNIDIDFHRNDAVHFRPLIDYADTSREYYKSVVNEPQTAENLHKGDCPGFRFPGALPTQQRNVQFPLWGAPFGPVDYVDDTVDASPSSGGGSSWWIWLIIALLLLLIVAILVILCVWKPCRKNEDSNANNRRPDIHVGPKYPEQHIPLNPGLPNVPIGNGAGIQDDYTLPPPNKPLYSDVASGRIEGHPTEPPPNYEGPRSNKDYFEDDFDPIDKESQYGEGYGEEKPEINDENTRNMSGVTIRPMSSFGKADRTAPPRSPLNRSPPVHGEPKTLKPIITPKPKSLYTTSSD